MHTKNLNKFLNHLGLPKAIFKHEVDEERGLVKVWSDYKPLNNLEYGNRIKKEKDNMEQLLLKGQIEEYIDAEDANKILAELTRTLNKYDIDYRFYVTDEIDTTGIDADIEVSVFHPDNGLIDIRTRISKRVGEE